MFDVLNFIEKFSISFFKFLLIFLTFLLPPYFLFFKKSQLLEMRVFFYFIALCNFLHLLLKLSHFLLSYFSYFFFFCVHFRIMDCDELFNFVFKRSVILCQFFVCFESGLKFIRRRFKFGNNLVSLHLKSCSL